MPKGKPGSGVKRQEVLSKEPFRTMTIGWIAEGKRQGELLDAIEEASGYRPSRQGLIAFRKRHGAEIAHNIAKVAARVEDLSIKDREERIRRLDSLYNRMDEVLQTRGIMTTDIVWVGNGPNGRFVKKERVDTPTIREMRGILEDVSHELGEFQPPPTTGPTINLLQLVASDGDARAHLQGALAALFLGGDDAGVVGGLREPEREPG